MYSYQFDPNHPHPERQQDRKRPAELPPVAPGAQPVGECACCCTYIYWREPVAEIFVGVAGVSPQNGQMLAEAESTQTACSFTMHRVCAIRFVAEEVCSEEAEEELHMMAEEMAEEMIESMMQEGEIEERYRQRIGDPDA